MLFLKQINKIILKSFQVKNKYPDKLLLLWSFHAHNWRINLVWGIIFEQVVVSPHGTHEIRALRCQAIVATRCKMAVGCQVVVVGCQVIVRGHVVVAMVILEDSVFEWVAEQVGDFLVCKNTIY